VGPLRRLKINAHLVDVAHAALLQQGLGSVAERAGRRGIHANEVHAGAM
jgi:hypothetical protein